MDTHNDEIEQAFREGYMQGQKESAELKWLLRSAMATIELLNDKLDVLSEDTDVECCKDSKCENCLMTPIPGTCEWRYEREAVKLLGDNQ